MHEYSTDIAFKRQVLHLNLHIKKAQKHNQHTNK